jgi:4'-phosphopantetheinyl transferase
MPLAALCAVHLARLSHLQDRHTAILDDAETERRARFTFADDRDRFTLGAALLRIAVGGWLRVEPASVTVTRDCDRCGRQHGRPRLPRTGLEVSVSHSVDVVAVAVTAAGPVGVDVEKVGPAPSPELLASVCTTAEREFVRSPADFYRYWTKKEAVLKASGQGMARELTDVVVTAPTQPPSLLHLAGARTPRCSMAEVVADGYAGAVAVLATDPVEFIIDAGTSLRKQ